MDLDEALSRLVDGDLDATETSVLRQRIASEPDVARRYGEMIALVGALEGLPEEFPVSEERRPAVWIAAGWLVAAAAVAWMLLPVVPVQTVQAAGVSLYDGEHQVQAGDSVVQTDGSVSIRVEPRVGLVRGGGQEDTMKAMSHAIAAAAGALVTVTVYEGTASVRGGEEGAPMALEAGDTRSFGGAPKPERITRTGPGPSSDALDEARVQELEQELGRLREELGQERFAKILMKGQLEAERGVPAEWPEDVSTQMSPEGFPDALAELVAGIPDVELVETDCQEYPCLGALRYIGDDGSMGWGQPIAKRIGEWAKGGLGESVNLSIANIDEGDGDEAQRFLVFGAHGDERASNTSQRVGRRMEELGTQLMDDVSPQ